MGEYLEQVKRRKELEKKLTARPTYIDEKLNYIVNVNVDDGVSFLSNYSDSKNVVINEELAGYLKNATDAIPVKKRVHLRFRYKKADDENKNNFSKAIKNYYANQLVEVKRLIKKNIGTMFLTLLFAIIFLTLWVVVTHFNLPAVVCMVVQIIAWAFVGQAVQLLFVRHSALMHARNKILQIIDAKITFVLIKQPVAKPVKKPAKKANIDKKEQ